MNFESDFLSFGVQLEVIIFGLLVAIVMDNHIHF